MVGLSSSKFGGKLNLNLHKTMIKLHLYLVDMFYLGEYS